MARALIAGLIAVMVLGVVGCDIFDDDDETPILGGTGSVSVNMDTGPGPVATPGVSAGVGAPAGSILVTIDSMTIWNSATTADPVTLFSEPQQVDLIAFYDAPAALVEDVPIPDGRYNCLGGQIGGLAIDLEGDGTYDCSLPVDEDPLAAGDFCLDGEFLDVQNNVKTVLMRIPLISADCEGGIFVDDSNAGLFILN
ncbi:MAG: hypothetical protein JSV80_02720 [Acidobacteriota bacterium]|nr:MAG: hypothetical protein JSV80_02720 [Acidobacteriota bacterium]